MKKIIKEKLIRGRGVSRGVSAGSVRIINSRGRRLAKIPISEADIPYELKRLRTAFKLAERSLKRLVRGAATAFGDSRSEIFEAQLEILRDPSLRNRMEREIGTAWVNSEWAIQRTVREFSDRLGKVADLHIKERAVDVQDLGERLLNALSGRSKGASYEGNYVVVTDQIYPSALAEFGSALPSAIVTERGGWTSHAFILARELGIPAVTGVHGATRRFKDGMSVLVDGFAGEVLLEPSQTSLATLDTSPSTGDSAEICEIRSESEPAVTTDGVEIALMANLDVPKSFEMASEVGAMGIGLFRSEFLIKPGKGFPTEKEQLQTYEQLGGIAGKYRARIRTFDISSGEAQGDADHFERNPALGLRATRLMLNHEPREFRTQLRALLRASASAPVDIVLPMVSDLSEIVATRELIEAETLRLSEKGIPFGKPRVGVMLEVPSLLFILEPLLKSVDFLSLGTNDLVQYLLAVDRDNESVADSFRTLHPSVLVAIKSVIDASLRAGKEILVCGEMAGSYLYAPILVGLGATNLSMNVRAISRVRNIINSISARKARELAALLLRCESAKESERALLDFYEKNWPVIFPRDLLLQSMLAKRHELK